MMTKVFASRSWTAPAPRLPPSASSPPGGAVQTAPAGACASAAPLLGSSPASPAARTRRRSRAAGASSATTGAVTDPSRRARSRSPSRPPSSSPAGSPSSLWPGSDLSLRDMARTWYRTWLLGTWPRSTAPRDFSCSRHARAAHFGHGRYLVPDVAKRNGQKAKIERPFNSTEKMLVASSRWARSAAAARSGSCSTQASSSSPSSSSCLSCNSPVEPRSTGR